MSEQGSGGIDAVPGRAEEDDFAPLPDRWRKHRFNPLPSLIGDTSCDHAPADTGCHIPDAGLLLPASKGGQLAHAAFDLPRGQPVSPAVVAGAESPDIHYGKPFEAYRFCQQAGQILLINRSSAQRRGRRRRRRHCKCPRAFPAALRNPEATVASGGVVQENWPPVIPKLKLFRTRRVRSRLRRQAARKCAPPMPMPAVSHGHHHLELRLRQLDAGGIGEGPTVKAVEGVGVEKGVKEPRTADIAHHDDVVGLQAELLRKPDRGRAGSSHGHIRGKRREAGWD